MQGRDDDQRDRHHQEKEEEASERKVLELKNRLLSSSSSCVLIFSIQATTKRSFVFSLFFFLFIPTPGEEMCLSLNVRQKVFISLLCSVGVSLTYNIFHVFMSFLSQPFWLRFPSPFVIFVIWVWKHKEKDNPPKTTRKKKREK